MPRTMGELMDERLSQREAAVSSWEVQLVDGVSKSPEAINQFITNDQKPTGFVWGDSVWGFDAVDIETSDDASKYGLT